jgi:hypothetical protein
VKDELSARELAWRDRALVDFPFFCRSLQIRIKSEDDAAETQAALGPFIWNEPQWVVWMWMCRQMELGLPIRLIILKARQFGISTFFCAWIFWWCWRKSNLRCIIAAQSKNTTLAAMSETMNRFYTSLPDGFRPPPRQKGAERLSKDEMYFADRMSGSLYLAADKPDSARGDAVDHALCTEVAMYAQYDEFFGAFQPAMGRRRDTTLVKESSAKPGRFWDAYRAGKKHDQSLFLPWSVYRSLYHSKLIRDKHGRKTVWRCAKSEDIVHFSALDRKEMEYLSRQNRLINEVIGIDYLKPCDEEQMWWRQQVIDTEYNGDVEWFNQEYPRDDISAFEKSVRGVFKSILPIVRAQVEETLEDPAFDDALVGAVLECETLTDTDRDSHTIKVLEDDSVDFEGSPGAIIYKWPIAGYHYTIGCDVADEMGTAADEDDAAFSAICVFCCETREQVAEWHGSIDPHDLGDEVAKLGYLYNTALINVEYNNMGVTTIDRLVKYIEYPNRFRWPKFDEAGKLTKKEMWWTDEKTKQLLIGSLRHAIRNALFKVRSAGLQEEITGYQVKAGHMKAGPGLNADRIIAAGLAWQGVEQTDFGMAQVLGAAEEASRDGARGAAQRVVDVKPGSITPPPRALPEEFDHDGHTQTVDDIWEVAASF